MFRSGRAFQELMQGLCGRGLANAGSRQGSPLERQVGDGKGSPFRNHSHAELLDKPFTSFVVSGSSAFAERSDLRCD